MRWGWSIMMTALFCCPSLQSQAEWTIENGWLTCRQNNQSLIESSKGSASNIVINDAWLIDDKTEPFVTALEEGGWLIRYETPQGILTEQVTPFAPLGPNAFKRFISYTNTSDASQDLIGARLSLHPIRDPQGNTWLPADHLWMGEIGNIPELATVCVAYRGTTDFYNMKDEEGRIDSNVAAIWRLKPGETATVGDQYIWLNEGGLRREEAQRWFEAVGLTYDATMLPDWARSMILYEAGAHGHIDSRFSDVGGFDAFIEQLDYLADLGISAIWLNAVHQHKSPPNPILGGWNHYAPMNFHTIDPILGGMDGFIRLCNEIRAREIHVIGEIVPHGGHSQEASTLEAWHLRDRQGELVKPWGGYGVDYASPQWQEIMKQALAVQSTQAGIEGVRVDVADGNGVHWNSPRGNHISISGLAGSIEMLQAMREGLAMGYDKPVVIPETLDNRPEHVLIPGSIGYGFRLIFYLAALERDELFQPERLNQQLTAFLENERGSLPKGFLSIRTLNNHDTVCEFGRVQYRFGAGLSRALYGICLIAPGIPMMYQEEEIGSYEILRKMNFGRGRIPEMIYGDVDYYGIQYSQEVFSAVRFTDEGQLAIGLSNLSGNRISADCQLTSRGAGRNAHVYDAVSGREAEMINGSFKWSMDPYEVCIIRIGEPPIGEIPARRFCGVGTQIAEANSTIDNVLSSGTPTFTLGTMTIAMNTPTSTSWELKKNTQIQQFESEAGTLQIEKDDDAWMIEMSFNPHSPPPTLSFTNVDQWMVSSESALWHDRMVRRHHPFPKSANYYWDRTMPWGPVPPYNQVCPIGRVWQSVIDPLHPENHRLAFADTQGNAFVIEVLQTSSDNIVLTDLGDELEKPFGLELRFYHDDPDLTPETKAFGLRQLWQLDQWPEQEHVKTQYVQLKITSLPIEQALQLLDAERIPRRQSGPMFEGQSKEPSPQGGIMFSQESQHVWRWSKLSAVEGVYQIGLELRYSEASADGQDLMDAYIVEVDGIKQPLEWSQLNVYNTGNAWFGYAYTPPLDLSGKSHQISVQTLKPWCGLRSRLILKPVASD